MLMEHDSSNANFQNWSDQPFAENVISWYWGHGRVGPYSIVWFDFLATNGVEHVSAYAAKDGKILVSSCDLSSIRVRPTGENATYPPLLTTGPPSGYHITLDLGAEDGVLELDVAAIQSLIATPVYRRWAGNITGAVGTEGAVEAGVALFEQFALTK
jgi:hypothetical protein